MTRLRLSLIVLFSFAVLAAFGRIVLELAIALSGGEVHTSVIDTPIVWMLAALFAAWATVVSIVLAPRRIGPRSRPLVRLGHLGMVAFLATSLLGCSSCATVKDHGKQVLGDVIDCTTSEASKLDKQFGPLVDKVLELAVQGDGGIDWPTVKDATKQFATDMEKCVVARSIARLLKPAPAGSDAPQSSPLEVDRDRLFSGWRQLSDGHVFHTPDGDI